MEIKKYWKYYLVFGLILVIAGFAPVIFTGTWSYYKFDTQTGPIGDTIGGLTAPFMSLGGSVLVFLALKEQIKANEIVLINFEIEKNEKSNNEQTKWEIFLLDLDAILKEIEEQLNILNEYNTKCSEDPFAKNILGRLVSNNHKRIANINRDIIFTGFKKYFKDDQNWKTYYHRLYELLDYIPVFFEELYKNNDGHVLDNFKIKKEIAFTIDQLMNEIVEQIELLRNEYSSQFLASNEVKILDQFLISYNKKLESNPYISLKELSENLRLEFLVKLIGQNESLRIHPKTFELTIKVKNITKEIFKIEQSEIDFNIHLKELYDSFVIDKADRKGTYNEFNELVDLLKK